MTLPTSLDRREARIWKEADGLVEVMTGDGILADRSLQPEGQFAKWLEYFLFGRIAKMKAAGIAC